MNIIVRNMITDDINTLFEEFSVKQGWKEKSIELFSKYFAEQNNNERKVLIAEIAGKVAGYLTLLPNDTEGPFSNKNIPTVCDFNVLIEYRRHGVGSALMDEAERITKQSSNIICLGVGLYPSYGTAQRMYVKRGYIPDGSGVWWKNKNLQPYEECVNDDDLILYMSKQL